MLKPSYYEGIEKQILEIFRKIMFEPIVAIMRIGNPELKVKRVFNDAASDNALREALRTGKIQYTSGVFSGTFSSATSRALREMGATFEPKRKLFNLDPAKTPPWVREQSAAYQSTAKATHSQIVRTIDDVQRNLDSILDRSDKVDARGMVGKVIADYHSVAKQMEVQPKLGSDSKERLAADYTDNMDLWIKKFIQEEIVELREQVEDNAMEGYRFDKLVARIQGRYGVTENKAKFLARQETALFVSKFRQQRFMESGVRRYRWSTSHDERVRYSHKELNGKIFFYANPPITSGPGEPARRNNPGEDYNCRCVDMPILEPAGVTT